MFFLTFYKSHNPEKIQHIHKMYHSFQKNTKHDNRFQHFNIQ